jgi:hypothetical protein
MRSIASQLSRSLERNRGEESPLPHGLQDHNPGTRGFPADRRSTGIRHRCLSAVFRTIPVLPGVWNGATGVAREESEAVQNFLRGIWRMNRGKNPRALFLSFFVICYDFRGWRSPAFRSKTSPRFLLCHLSRFSGPEGFLSISAERIHKRHRRQKVYGTRWNASPDSHGSLQGIRNRVCIDTCARWNEPLRPPLELASRWVRSARARRSRNIRRQQSWARPECP